MSRRLPVYLLIDTSGSMMGEAIEAVRSGLKLVLSTLSQDPYALETAYLSLITFSSQAKQEFPLTDVMSLQLPDINANGTTAMGEALELLADCVNREVKKGSMQEKGDWRPMVFMMTDGMPTDNLDKGIQAIKQHKFGAFIACAAGSDADTDTLKKITETVVSLDTADSASIKAFLKWISQSITTTSKKVDLTKSDESSLDELPPPPPELNIVL